MLHRAAEETSSKHNNQSYTTNSQCDSSPVTHSNTQPLLANLTLKVSTAGTDFVTKDTLKLKENSLNTENSLKADF